MFTEYDYGYCRARMRDVRRGRGLSLVVVPLLMLLFVGFSDPSSPLPLWLPLGLVGGAVSVTLYRLLVSSGPVAHRVALWRLSRSFRVAALPSWTLSAPGFPEVPRWLARQRLTAAEREVLDLLFGELESPRPLGELVTTAREVAR